MHVPKFTAILAGTLMLAGMAQATAQQATSRPPGVLELRGQLSEAREQGDYAAWSQAASDLNDLRPNNAEYMIQYVLANAMLDDKPQAYSMMVHMQQQGLSFDFDSVPETEAIRDTDAYEYIADLLRMQGRPVGVAEIRYTLPEQVLIPTSVAWDAGRQSLLVGAARQGIVFAIKEDGQVEELINSAELNGMWGVYGLYVDQERNRLLVSTGANPQFERYDPVDSGRSALFEFELDTLKFLHRYPVPVDGRPHRLGQLAVTPNGDVYMADNVLPVLYTLKAGSERIKPFVGSPEMVSLRGMVSSPDGHFLFVADYEMGIIVIDLVEEKLGLLQTPPNLHIGGIEGLQWWEGNLVAIQNLNRPQRVMRLTLDENSYGITDVAPVAVALPEFDHPSYGVMVGEELLFLANSHWGGDPANFKPIQVAATNIASPPDLTRPDVEKFLRDLEKKKAAVPGQ
jgi:hypothetical protein